MPYHRGWTPYISGVRTLVIRLLSNKDGENFINELYDVLCAVDIAQLSQWIVKHGRLTPISKREAKNSGLRSILGHHSHSLVHRFFPTAFLSHHFAFIIKSTARSNGLRMMPKKASKVTIFGFNLEWLYSY